MKDVEVISTGSLALDIALGIGGLPKGRIVEIYGPESSGKNNDRLSTIAQAQKKGGVVASWMREHALDVNYARVGVNTEDLLISQPDGRENKLWNHRNFAFRRYRRFGGGFRGGLGTRAEIEGEMGDSHGFASTFDVSSFKHPADGGDQS